MKGTPPSHQSWNVFSVWNFGVERLVELQLGSLDTSNCQLLLEREGREGTPVGPGVGGQAEPLTALSRSNFNPLYSSLHPPVPPSFTSSDTGEQLVRQGTSSSTGCHFSLWKL